MLSLSFVAAVVVHRHLLHFFRSFFFYELSLIALYNIGQRPETIQN